MCRGDKRPAPSRLLSRGSRLQSRASSFPRFHVPGIGRTIPSEVTERIADPIHISRVKETIERFQPAVFDVLLKDGARAVIYDPRIADPLESQVIVPAFSVSCFE